MGKALFSNITVSLGFVVVPKALAMARLSAAASLLAILLLSSSRFCRRFHCTATILSPAGSLLLITGRHPTANHGLAPYGYSSAGTLLLTVVDWHPLSPLVPSPSTLPIGWPLLGYTY